MRFNLSAYAFRSPPFRSRYPHKIPFQLISRLGLEQTVGSPLIDFDFRLVALGTVPECQQTRLPHFRLPQNLERAPRGEPADVTVPRAHLVGNKSCLIQPICGTSINTTRQGQRSAALTLDECDLVRLVTQCPRSLHPGVLLCTCCPRPCNLLRRHCAYDPYHPGIN